MRSFVLLWGYDAAWVMSGGCTVASGESEAELPVPHEPCAGCPSELIPLDAKLFVS
jgi:hypothetical protein